MQLSIIEYFDEYPSMDTFDCSEIFWRPSLNDLLPFFIGQKLVLLRSTAT